MTIVSNGNGITHINFSAPGKPGQTDGQIALVCDYLDAYFSGQQPELNGIVCMPSGTPFQMRIWNYLREIPYGRTVTYGALAKRYAMEFGLDKMSAQAVGQAVGANPIPILIPCHRVVGAGGKLTGFSGGLEKKITLLQIEKAL